MQIDLNDLTFFAFFRSLFFTVNTSNRRNLSGRGNIPDENLLYKLNSL